MAFADTWREGAEAEGPDSLGNELVELAGQEDLADLVAPMPGWDLRVGIHSERGTRSRNDDYARALSDSFALADGIGGAPYGDVIARVAVNDALDLWDYRNDFITAEDPAERLRKVFLYVHNFAQQLDYLLESGGSGSTLVVGARVEDELWLASIGDSAAYALREGTLTRLTPLGRAQEGSSQLNHAIGASPRLARQIMEEDALAIWHGQLHEGDVYLVCSDGVWTNLGEQDLAELLAPAVAPRPNVQRVAFDIACAGVRADNATALVVAVGRDGHPDGQDGATGLLDWEEHHFDRTPEADLYE